MDAREREAIERLESEAPLTREVIRRKRREIARRRRRRFFGCLFLLILGLVFLTFVLFIGYTLVNWTVGLYHEYQSARSGYELRQEARRGKIDPRFDGYTNVLVLGLDEGADAQTPGEKHADTIFLLSMENETGKVRIVTIPRDTWASYPEGGSGRLGNLYASGEAPAMVRAVSQLLGISIHQYITLDMKAMADLIDALGGIDVYVESDMNYDDPAGGTSIHLKKGYQHLTGTQAEEYIRYVSPELGEAGRIQRQQKFAKALYEEILQVDTIPRLPAIAEIFKKEVDTSAEIFDSAHLANVVRSLSSEQPASLMLPGSVGDGGEWVPDKAEIEEKMGELFTPASRSDEKDSKE